MKFYVTKVLKEAEAARDAINVNYTYTDGITKQRTQITDYNGAYIVDVGPQDVKYVPDLVLVDYADTVQYMPDPFS